MGNEKLERHIQAIQDVAAAVRNANDVLERIHKLDTKIVKVEGRVEKLEEYKQAQDGKVWTRADTFSLIAIALTVAGLAVAWLVK